MKTNAWWWRAAKLLLSVGFWVCVWLLLSWRVNNTFLLPDPLVTVKTLGRLSLTGAFWVTALSSLWRVLRGILLGAVLGAVLGILTSVSGVLRALVSPLMTAVKATPIASFIILALIWMQRDALPVLITVLIVLPVMWASVSGGIEAVDRELWEVTKVYRFSFGKRLRVLYLPSVMPYVATASRSAVGMAWKAGIAAEVLCTPKTAIGTELYFAKTYMMTEELFAWTLAIILLSVLLEALLSWLLRGFSNRKGKGVSARAAVE
ncbi:MAG: ABC transporter permease subunit [Ruminococcaceae bacterium]|nr:ABC transporter permease subunit [Oscillospiraceae bacterium]